MSNQFGFVSENTFSQKIDSLIDVLGDIAFGVGGRTRPATWNGIQQVVRAGKASQVFGLGDRLSCMKGDTQLVWEVIGFDHDTPADTSLTHSMTLQLRTVFDTMQFSPREAFYYCQSGLTAGTYYFMVEKYRWSQSEENKYFQFTLTNDVPSGGQLYFDKSPNSAFSGKNVLVYSSAYATTPTETAVMSEGSTGTSLGTLNYTIQGNLNSVERAIMGSNNYQDSSIRQYINSSAAAGYAWGARQKWDRPPEWKETLCGWMYDIDPDFLAVVGEVQKYTALNTISDGGGRVTVTDKFFLLSSEEGYFGRVNNIDEGGPYLFYSAYSDLPSAGIGADSNRVKNNINGVPSTWWLRSPYTGDGYNVGVATTSGAKQNLNAVTIQGIAPCCDIV